MIRVAQIIGKAAAGGVESVIMNLYKNIDRENVQFDFFVEQTSTIIDENKIKKLGGNVVIIPSYKRPIRYVKELTKLFKDGQYDIVHSNMNALSVFALMAAKKAGIKIRIAHSHSTTNKKEFFRNILKNLLRPFSKKYATHYFACSEFAGRWLFGNKTFNEGKVTIVNNAIDLKKFVYDKNIRQQIRIQYQLEDKFVIGHVGRFTKQKNHKFLIDVFNNLQKECLNAVLLLVGEGPLYSKINKYVQELNLTEKVIFTGVQKDVSKYYQAMDCFVLPSLYEGLPVVGIEAQANGLPCVFANTITKEVLVNENAKMLSLNAPMSSWVGCILKLKEREKKEFNNFKYNIINEAKKLHEEYLKMMEAK